MSMSLRQLVEVLHGRALLGDVEAAETLERWKPLLARTKTLADLADLAAHSRSLA